MAKVEKNEHVRTTAEREAEGGRREFAPECG